MSDEKSSKKKDQKPSSFASPEEERKAISGVYYNELKKGDVWYIVPRKWWQQWCTYSGFQLDDNPTGDKSIAPSGPRPTDIDSSELILEGQQHIELKQGLVEHLHYELLHSRVWEIIGKEYDASPVISRQTITTGFSQQERIELYPQFLSVSIANESGEPSETKILSVSLEQTLGDVLNSHKTEQRSEGRIWLKKGANEEEKKWVLAAEDANVKLGDLQFPSLTEVLLDFKRGDNWSRVTSSKDWRNFEVGDKIDAWDRTDINSSSGKWYESTILDVKPEKIFVHFDGWSAKYDEWIEKTSPRLAPKNKHTTGPYKPKDAESSSYSSGWGSSYRAHESGKPPERGAVGLRNLGNTCFMNSTLQCMSNSPGFTQFFVEKKYKSQINKKNPLGWGGKVAEAYGDLLADMWSGEYRAVAPSKFKDVIGEFQPRFSGYQQHDSSELLSFLLDGLHEDLNRVKEKPYTKAVESNSRPDSVVAREAWHRHLLRNQSIVVDMFQGQLKSRVVCPDCKTESITFDPFMFLSIPLPGGDNSVQFQVVTFVPAARGAHEETFPRKVSVKIPKAANIKDFIDIFSKEHAIPANELAVHELYNGKVFQVFKPDARLFGARDDIWVTHLPQLAENIEGREPVHRVVPVLMCAMANAKQFKHAGPPILTTLPYALFKACPMSEIRKALRPVLRPWIKGDWKEGENEAENYLLEVTTESGELRGEVDPKTDVVLNLEEKVGGVRVGLGVFFTVDRAERYQNPLKDAVGSPSAKPAPKEAINIATCIDLLTTEEVLPQSEAYYCGKCKGHKCASKKFDLWMLPDLLIIHLKRFSYNRVFREKIEDYVDFPLEGLNMSKWISNPDEKKAEPIYDLYAVSNHYGGLGGGHYTAFAKNLLNNKWYNLDDSSVSPVDAESVKTKAAYVLFYARRTKKNQTYEPKAFE